MRLTLAEATTEITRRICDVNSLVGAVFSGRLSNASPNAERIDVRFVNLGRGTVMQVVMRSSAQATTMNHPLDAAVAVTQELINQGFAHVTITSRTEKWQCRFTRKRIALVHVEEGLSEPRLHHDAVKNRMLSVSHPLLRAVGIADQEGKLKPSKTDKYRQIDDFLRVLAATMDKAFDAGQLPQPSADRPLNIVDLGCGHAYLTFAAYAWATDVKGWPVQVMGVDRRVDSLRRNQELATRVGAHGMSFIAADIADAPFVGGETPHVVLALHACDTATDDALAWAVRHKAHIVLAAPCCHHHAQSQSAMTPEPWSLLARHGIVRERLLDLITDSLRAAVLRERGYRSDLFEFVGGEHTPRNIMLRAVKTGVRNLGARDERVELSKMWGIEPALLTRLGDSDLTSGEDSDPTSGRAQ